MRGADEDRVESLCRSLPEPAPASASASEWRWWWWLEEVDRTDLSEAFDALRSLPPTDPALLADAARCCCCCCCREEARWALIIAPILALSSGTKKDTSAGCSHTTCPVALCFQKSRLYLSLWLRTQAEETPKSGRGWAGAGGGTGAGTG